jgi:hypothetical protein
VKGFFSHVLITHHTSKRKTSRTTPHILSPRLASNPNPTTWSCQFSSASVLSIRIGIRDVWGVTTTVTMKTTIMGDGNDKIGEEDGELQLASI